MPDCFIDSSALIKRYVDEKGSDWLRQSLHGATFEDIFIAAITPVEVVAAITRRGRGGTIAVGDASAASGVFQAHVASQYEIVHLTPAVLRRAVQLAERYALRGYDAVQFASALSLNEALASSVCPLPF